MEKWEMMVAARCVEQHKQPSGSKWGMATLSCTTWSKNMQTAVSGNGLQLVISSFHKWGGGREDWQWWTRVVKNHEGRVHHSWPSSVGHLQAHLCPMSSGVKLRHPYNTPSPQLSWESLQVRLHGKERQANTSVAGSSKCCYQSSHHGNY